MKRFRSLAVYSLMLAGLGSFSWCLAQAVDEPGATEQAEKPSQPTPPKEPAAPPKEAAPSQFKKLSPEHQVWIDQKNKRVIIGGQVSMREGMLEMFACLKGTKEHESVVACNTQAFIVHAALLAVGAKPGHPVKFPSDDTEQYRPAAGTQIDITVHWTDAKGVRRFAKGQDWIRNNKTGKAMEYHWVFAGSGFWVDGDNGEKHYMAEGGDFICVSNFPSAMLDLPIQSPQDNENLLFEAFKEHIPDRGTKVMLVLTPKLDESAAEKADEAAAAKAE